MRWGITDDSALKNLSATICINEIKNCIKDSNGPCFIVSRNFSKINFSR